MSDDALKVIGLVCAFITGVSLGCLITGLSWRADCDNIGSHQSSNSQVYDCKPRIK